MRVVRQVLLLALILAGVATAQNPPLRPPPGAHEYGVRGFIQGQEMDPWDAELSIVDSALGLQSGLRAMYKSRLQNGAFQFVYAASWLRNDARRVSMSWHNNGHAPSTCDLSIDEGRLTGAVSIVGTITPITLSRVALPDFALSAYVANRPFQDGDSLPITVVRCLPGGDGDPVTTADIALTVRKSAEPRGAGKEEPAWLVEGPATYPFKAWIGAGDRMFPPGVRIVVAWPL